MAYIKPTNIIVNGRGITSSASSATGISPVTLNVNTATTATLGIIQVGSGLSITPDGVLSATGGGTGNGYTGSAGSNGSVGFTGSAGSTGTQGSVGFSGSAGSTGTQGSAGFTGSAGSTGGVGSTGTVGFTGSAGSAGAGFTGSAGSTGTVGFTGSRGVDGVTTTTTVAAVTTIIGTTSTTAGIPGYSTRIYTGSLNDGYTLPNGDLYIWKGGDTPGAGPTVEYLVIAGGGGGGFGASSSSGGGGGGAGGYRSSVVGESSGRNSSAESALSVIAGTVYSVTVGAGGATGATGGARGIDGSTSSFSTIVSIGGGGGGGSAAGGDAARSGAIGGSGGGGAGINPYTNNYGGAGTTGQGYAGGDSLSPAAPNYPSAGGGGAGSVGGSQVNQTTGGNGGSGLSSSITGTPTIRGGGGGGATYGGGTPGTGGSGGGGAGGNPTGAVAGTPNTGGGGGGGTNGTPGAAGGSGIVVIRYPDSYSTATSTTGNPTAVTTSGYRIYSWTTVGSGSITFPAGATVTGQGWVFVGNIKGIPGEAAAIGYTGSAGSAGSAGSTGPKISSVTVTDSSYNNLDDTAVALTGGYIKIAGSGFESGCQVLLGTTLATSVSYISSTEVRAQLPAASTGTYIIYLVNSDGGTAIRVNAVTFSPTPSWTTGAELSGSADTAISIQLAATDATSYSLAAGSSLPSGVTLSSGGLLSGTITGLSADTTYNFTIIATDAELQDSTRAFTFTITIGDTYFKYVTMLLAGNGTNLAQNNTFIDSSTNNFAITRAGNVSQGTFTPYGSNWSIYQSDASSVYVGFTTSVGTSFQFTGDFTIEGWVYYNTLSGDGSFYVISDGSTYLALNISMSAGVYNIYLNSGSPTSSFAHGISVGTWAHVAMVRSGSTVTLYTNGVSKGTISNSSTLGYSAPSINRTGGGVSGLDRYISNIRVVKGTAVYTSAFTPSIIPLTAITNTQLLTCQSNRFVDNSSNAFIATITGSLTVKRFSPFSPPTPYSTSTIGGSGYFNGSSQLSFTANSAFAFGTGDFTVECWYFATSNPGYRSLIETRASNGTNTGWALAADSGGAMYVYANGFIVTGITIVLNTWNHVAFTRSGSTQYLFLNGVLVSSAATARTYSDTNLGVGGISYGTGEYWTGYLSNVRLIKGTCLYTTTFTPSTVPLTAIANTSLLLNYTNAGIIDNSMMNNLETVGDVKITTALSKFGSGSLVFDGTGDVLKSIPSIVNVLSNGDFTIEFWLYPSNTSSAYRAIVSSENYPGTTGGWSLYQYGTAIEFWITSGASATVSANSAITASTWQHLAICRASGTLRLFINGTSVSSASNSTSLTGQQIWIGDNNSTGGGLYFYNGYLDDLRITKGYARYTATFTPPTAAHPLK